MPTSIIVVDDFFADAQGFREAGLKLTYPDQTGSLFPGRNSAERLQIPGLEQHVSQLTGERLRPLPPPAGHGRFRLTLANDIGNAGVHVDPGYWSGILYLSRPGDCQGGTDFFRHKRTNTDRRPMSDQEVAALGYKTYADCEHDILGRDTLDPEAWEKTMTVPMRFNRLLLLRPWLWHTAGPGFGDTPENGRLVYLLFFAPA
jgi:hypothetical protein